MKKIKLLLSAALVLIFISSCGPMNLALKPASHKPKVEQKQIKKQTKQQAKQEKKNVKKSSKTTTSSRNTNTNSR